MSILKEFVVLGLLMVCIQSSSSTILPNLRRFRMIGTVGRFVVPRETLESVIRSRIAADSQCGKHVSLSLPQSLPSEHFNRTTFGEILVAYTTVEEMDLDYLPCDLKEGMEISSKLFYVAIPFVSNGDHGVLTLVDISDKRPIVTPPWETNDEYRIIVDSIDENEENVTLRIGDDEMTLEVFQNTSCHIDADVGTDFEHVYGANVTVTYYPNRFDWNCGSDLDWDTAYCRVLKENLCEIERYGDDVCLYDTIKSPVRCSTSMKIKSVNGVFRDLFLGMIDDLPAESFETEWIDHDVHVGIKFPCLAMPPS